MSHNPFLAHAAPSAAAEATQPAHQEHASILDDLAGLDLSSPSFSTQSQAHAPDALASPRSAQGPTIGAAPTQSIYTDSGVSGARGGGAIDAPIGTAAPGAASGQATSHAYASPSFASPTFAASTTYDASAPSANTTSYMPSAYPIAKQYSSSVAYDAASTPAASSNPYGQMNGSTYSATDSHANGAQSAFETQAGARSTKNPFLATAPEPAPTLSYLSSSSTNIPASRAPEAPTASAAAPVAVPVAAPVATGAAAGVATSTAATNTTASSNAPATDPNSQSQIAADEAIARALAQESSADEAQWPLKDIVWNGRPAKIIMQNENGPCSLLALCNVLLLEQRLEITPADRPAVSYSYLSSKLTELLVTNNTSNDAVQLSAALRAMPSLQYGLDVNIGFSSPIDFVEDTAPDALALFRLAQVSLVHGWLPDPSDAPTTSALQQVGNYNAATVAVAQGNTPNSPPGGSAALICGFLDEYATQLTPYGIAQLRQRMRPNSLAVLFRNSHLSVLYRSANATEEPMLSTLVTDVGFLLEDRIVWESLQDPRGQYNAYYDSHLVRVPYTPQQRRTQPAEDGDEDYALALQLQNEERQRAMAARRRHRERDASYGRAPPSHMGGATDTSSSAPSTRNPLQKVWTKIKRKGGAP